MPRACVIVLDAVGAGELPDAADYGDEGSNTLANVAEAVGGLDLPNLEQLGLGNIEELAGCPPQPHAPAVAGRLFERSKGKDTTTGHWELMGIVTPEPMPTFPHGFPFEVIEEFAHRTGRGRARQQGRLGDGDHRRARRGAPADRQVDRLHVRRLRLPDRRARGDDPARRALRRLRDRPRDPDREERRRARDRPPVRRRARQLHAHAEPPRLVAQAAAAELPHARPRGGQGGLRRGQDPRHLRRRRHRPLGDHEVEQRRHHEDRGAPARVGRGAHLREPRRDGHALGPSQRPGQLPPLPAGLRPADPGSSRRAAPAATSSSSPPTTGATRRLPRPTTLASTRCCSPTSRGKTPAARFTRASSRTSARR